MDSEVFHLVDFCPKINISEDENNYYLHADLPGMTKDQVKTEITEDNTFILSGKRESIRKEETKNEKFSLMECHYGKFKRSFTLPEDVDVNHINAKMMNGVLEVTFRKIAPTKKDQTRTIQIH
ncbi:hypothetical protein PIROE2DRAFT_40167 [Piromyces sp. E2]|nr:hypothetical protein PIROE2DRAFT_40167 [Piromyces sp. E2]|eukprot:OUM67329.1 hypothetical protein PIROE2DRAFT_40167 [Piromyces sp. E2]